MWYFSDKFAHFPHLEEWNICIEYSINSIHSYRIFILRIWALSSLVVTGKMWILQVLFPMKWCVSQWLKHCWCECLRLKPLEHEVFLLYNLCRCRLYGKKIVLHSYKIFLTTRTWQFTWLFFLHAHRMDRTRVLLRWYQAWGSKEDKVVWALTTKDLVLIKVIKYIVCSPVSQSPQRGGLSQCNAPRQKWLEHNAGPWLREKLP